MSLPEKVYSRQSLEVAWRCLEGVPATLRQLQVDLDRMAEQPTPAEYAALAVALDRLLQQLSTGTDVLRLLRSRLRPVEPFIPTNTDQHPEGSVTP